MKEMTVNEGYGLGVVGNEGDGYAVNVKGDKR